MQAKVTKGFSGCPDGEVMARMIAVDETITGDLAKVAVDEGWAEEISEKPARGKKSDS